MSRNDQRRRERQERAQARGESRRARRRIEERQAKRKRMFTLIGGIAGGAVIIAGLLFLFTRESTPAGADEPVNPAPAAAIEAPRDGRTKGDSDAPVTVVEYGDFL